jgi:hypothetical protein
MVKKLQISVVGDTKQIQLHIINPEVCANASNLNHHNAQLLHDLTAFAERLLATNQQGGLVEVSPDNVVLLLGEQALPGPQPGQAFPGVVHKAAPAVGTLADPVQTVDRGQPIRTDEKGNPIQFVPRADETATERAQRQERERLAQIDPHVGETTLESNQRLERERLAREPIAETATERAQRLEREREEREREGAA